LEETHNEVACVETGWAASGTMTGTPSACRLARLSARWNRRQWHPLPGSAPLSFSAARSTVVLPTLHTLMVKYETPRK
jgi:hypothetical protein